ncbi:hypothetical protein AAVH_01843 [Aphelenchoides avenae]|nr:hypothetical protein AAVH_01843 [Aphelenchus avenae]
MSSELMSSVEIASSKRLSPGRRLGVLFDKGRLRVIWFQLTAEYPKPTDTVTSKPEAVPGKDSEQLAADVAGPRIGYIPLDTNSFDVVDLDSLDVEME